MAQSNPRKDAASDGTTKNARELDLSSEAGFADSTEWLRNHVLLGTPSASMLELTIRVAAPTPGSEERRLTLYLDTADGYIVGFRGHDGVYLLQEKGRSATEKLGAGNLIAKDERPRMLDSIGTDHRSFGTFRQIWNGDRLETRTFREADLRKAGCLSAFSSSGGNVSKDDVREALAILVCMTSESARSKTVEMGFQRIYHHAAVRPDTVIQAYSKAIRITRHAEVFPNRIRADRVEKLQKRAIELAACIQKANQLLGESDRRKFVNQTLQGTTPKEPPALANAALRVREMANELKLTDAQSLLEVISLCEDQDAIRAAKDGVAVPSIQKGAKQTQG